MSRKIVINVDCCRGPELGKLSWLLQVGQAAFRFKVSRKEKIRMQINEEQKVSGTVQPVTAAGHPAPIDGTPAWEIDPVEGNPIATLEVDATDPKKASFTALALPDGTLALTTQVRCRFDADLGDGVREIVAIGELTVVQAEAATAEVVFGAAEPQ
jgi:hypothetical protein